jgi:ATP phosphoribosyltransferase
MTHTALPKGRPLRIALPKGRLKKTLLSLLGDEGPGDKALSSRKLLLPRGPFEFLPLKDADIPTYVERGGAGVGIVGSDVLNESKADVLEPLDLGFGICKVVFCGKPDTSLRELHAEGQLRVATKYPRTALRALKQRGLMGDVIALSGTVEVALLTGTATAIMDLVETGRTLQENGLVVLEEVGPVSARVIVNRASFWLERAEVAAFLQLLSSRANEAGYAPLSLLQP